MTLFREEVPANFVPAAAVIRKGEALFEMIGRKEFVGKVSYLLNVWFLTLERHLILLKLEYNRG